MTVVSGAFANNPDMQVVLGVHIVSPIASDLIAEAEQLVGNRVPLADAARLIHPHPTFSETLGEALLKADGRRCIRDRRSRIAQSHHKWHGS